MIASPAFDDAFTSEKKLRYLEIFESNGGLICRTAYELGMHDDTVRKHLKIDPVFAKLIREAKQRSNERVESVLYNRALDPKGSFDRIVWLKHNYKAKYGDAQSDPRIELNINLNGNAENSAKDRAKFIEARVQKEVENGLDNYDQHVNKIQTFPTEIVDNQESESAKEKEDWAKKVALNFRYTVNDLRRTAGS